MAESTTRTDHHTFHGAGMGYQQNFKQWWMAARQSEEPPSPYAFLTNFGADRDTVSEILWQVMKDKCVLPDSTICRPGTIDYFVWHIYSRGGEAETEDDRSSLNDLLEDVLFDNPWEEDSTKQDILALAGARHDRYDWEDIMNRCLTRDFRGDFLQSMWDAMPQSAAKNVVFDDDDDDNERLGDEGCRVAFDQDCSLLVKTTLPKLKSLTLGGKWKKEAFVECLSLLPNSASIDRLYLYTPYFLKEDGTDDTEECPLPQVLPLETQATCGIQELTVDTTLYEGRGWPGIGIWALEIIPHLRNLHTLYMDFFALPLADAVPCLIDLLKSDTQQLRQLSLEAPRGTPVKGAMLDIMDALKSNGFLKKFSYVEHVPHEPNASELDPYEGKLLEVVCVNASLKRATLKQQKRYCLVDRMHGSSVQWSRIDYYLMLNSFGRGIARNRQTDLADFVALLQVGANSHQDYLFLSSIRQEESPEHIEELLNPGDRLCESAMALLLKLNINYGLLREMPGLWSSTSVGTLLLACGRKRKRDRREDTNPGTNQSANPE